MEISNVDLYETGEVVNKYAINTTRVRSLNEAEKIFIDRYDVKNKEVLVLGSGAGRVPANLVLYGNKVRGVELSNRLNKAANEAYPNSKFKDLILEHGDATNLLRITDDSYDVVFFPMNGIDLIHPYALREKAIAEMIKKAKKFGIVAFSSHNKIAYTFSPKVANKSRQVYTFENYSYKKESVVGGACCLKGTRIS